MMSDPIVRVQADMPDAVVRIEVANQGKDGYTPKRGVDYWTEEDVQEIHDYVDEQIGAGGGGSGAVNSVNGKTGAVMLAPEDIGAQPKGDYALKEEIPSVPTRLSQLEQDADHRLTTDAEKDAWNAKSDFSGKYADLQGKPTIPTVPTKVSAFENDVGYLTEHQDLSDYALKEEVPQIDDTAVSAESTWSSNNTVERFLPGFSESGAAVECHPFPLCPLNVSTTFEPAQAGSGEPSLDNIRQISGYDKLSLTRCGKNLLDVSNAVNNTKLFETVSSDGAITVKGSNPKIWTTSYFGKFRMVAGTTYTISGVLGYGRVGFSTDATKIPSDGFYPDISTKTSGAAGLLKKIHSTNIFTANETCDVYVWYCADADNDGSLAGFTMSVQIELGSVATPYEPYRGDTYTVHLGDTVYGGTYDWSKGELMSEWAHMRMADQNWTASTSKPGRFSINAVGTYARRVAPMCNIMPGWAGFSPDLRYTLMNNEGDQLIIITDFTSLDQLITWLDENDAYMCYKLAEPITIQLAPLEIMPLDGTNVLISNPGDTTVSGKLDPIYLHEQNKAAAAKLAGMETRLRALESAAVNNA